MMGQPLDGVVVIALEQAVAAPFATRQLADLGARVIKVERPVTGDFARHYDETVLGQSSHFVWINRGKESVALNLKTPEGVEILEALLSRADVLVQNLRPGALEQLGFSAERMQRQFPRLIACNISGYGPDGPLRERKAYDLLIQAESGLLSITGTPEKPAKVGVSIADIAAGMYALTSILSAIIHRGRTEKGTVIEVSMLEALAEWMGYPLNFTHFSGTPPARSGAHHATIAPYGPYPVADGREVFLGVQNDREWRAFCTVVLERPELGAEARFVTNSQRIENREALEKEILQVFSQLDLEEALKRLERAHIAYARLNTVEELWNHPQLRARKRWRMVDTEKGAIEALLPPMNLWGVEPVMGAVPALGEHTQAILEELGLSEEKVRGLLQKGVI